MIETTRLTDAWVLRTTVPADDAPDGAAGWRLPASVPSVVHTVLLDHGLIPDPYAGQNEDTQHWIGRSEWEYATTFEHAGDRHRPTELGFEGLDTVAVIRLNGMDLAHTFNQHRSYTVDITDHVKAGINTLALIFKDVRAHAELVRGEAGEQPNENPEPFQYVRKSACNFGWDWGPNLVTAGPWKPVSIRRYTTARFQSVRPSITTRVKPAQVGTTPTHGSARVEVDVDLFRAPGIHSGLPLELALTVGVNGTTKTVPIVPDSSSATVVLELDEVELWWPHDMGAQPLSRLSVSLHLGHQTLDTWSKDVGFRDCELKTDRDENGTAFVFAVNGIDIFVKGANWIPDDCFPSRVTEDRLRERISQAIGANMNLLRVWGGGVYESDDFYDLCDRMGILVWQDFLFACAGYPEDGPLYDEVAGEVRDNVVRLMSHPSLVIWNGNNECIWGYEDWNWKAQLDGRGWGWRYYAELLPDLIAGLDATRPYWPGSPYSGNPELHPNDPQHGTVHIWDVWNQEDYLHYAEWNARFVSEFGFQGPPNWSTLARTLEPADLDLDAPAFLNHQKAQDGTRKLQRGLAAHLPEPADFVDWHFLTQVNQARAVRFGIEHFRAGSPVCAGSIVWQLNDCWPVTSWAAVDGYGQLKPLWYAIRDAYRPRLATVQQPGSELVVVLVNDTADPWRGTLSLELISTDAATDVTAQRLKVKASHRYDFDVEARATADMSLPNDVGRSDFPLTEVLVIRGEGIGPGDRILHFHAEDKDRLTEPARVAASAVKTHDGVAVTVTAHTVVRDLVLQADRMDPGATVSEQCISLLPGESHTFRVTTSTIEQDAEELERWTLHPVLQGVGLTASGIHAHEG